MGSEMCIRDSLKSFLGTTIVSAAVIDDVIGIIVLTCVLGASSGEGTGIGGVLIGSIMALAQYDFRRMLAYSSVAQIGYIAIGLAIGNMYGFIGAVLHIINHAFMKSALFLVIGGIQYRFGEINLYRLGGLNKKMTLSTITVTLAALSMVGIPPTAGFFSKWYLMLGAYQGGQYFYIVVLVISSLLNAVYFFRILEQMFVQHEASLTEINRHEGKLGLPPEMAIPILCAGIGILVLGFYSVDIVDDLSLIHI